MIKMKKDSLTINHGFTLVELLVVISVLGILASIVLVSFGGSQKQARDTQRKSDLKQYQNSLEAYANKSNGFYPQRTSATVASTTLCNDLALTTCPKDPKDPTYFYYYISDGSGVAGSASGTKYVLWASLENTTGFWVVCSNGKSAVSVSAPYSSTCPI